MATASGGFDTSARFHGSSSSHFDDERIDLLSGKRAGGKRLDFTHGEEDEDETDLVVSGRATAVKTLPSGRRRSFISRHRGPVAVVITLVVAIIIGVVIYFAVNTAEEKPSHLEPTAAPVSPPAPSCSGDTIAPEKRIDCYPETNSTATEADCLGRGCCWDASAPARGDGVIGQPACYYPKFFGYRTSTRENIPGIPNAFRMFIDDSHNEYPPLFPGTVHNLRVEVYQETESRLRVKIVDATNARYEVPLKLYNGTTATSQRKYTVTASAIGWTFSVSVRRTDTQTEIFNTSLGALIYSDQFLQISNSLPSKYIYGLGEHVDELLHNVNWTRLTLFSRDQFPGERASGQNLYGVQPFYMCVEPDGKAHGVLFRNSNAMDIILSPAPAITYRTVGGILDFYIFTGPTPDQVVQQYTQVVGLPFLPPYWSLGFHLCRWGYESSNHTMQVIQRMRAAKMPYDTQWNDIDYMREHLDFTYDTVTYATLPEMVSDLHHHGQRYIMIVDPGIANVTENYPWYTNGLDQKIFITDQSGTPIIGKVWPGTTAFPDFTNPETTKYWTAALSSFHQSVPFDGVWIDMNEPSNFVPGSINGCPESLLNNPPYVPDVLDNELYAKTLCMSAQQHVSTHYNVHSLYGHTEAMATMGAVRAITKKRGLVISRSTYTGSGNYTGHWLGDNASKWPDMALSIPGMLDFSIFGIPMIGADICGFRENTTEDLCQRWMQLGAFYPFSRNHNIKGALPQDPAAPRFSDSFRNSTRDALLMRYQYLPYLYTLFYKAATTGSSVARPLFFQYSDDVNTLSNDRQFLWGSDMLITPVLTEGAVTVDGYFPKDTWYDLRTGVALPSAGEVKTLDAPMDIIPLHVRAGAIIPFQEPNVTTNSSRKNPFGVIIAVGDDGHASGQLYLDDGETLDWYSDQRHTIVDFSFNSNAEPQVLKSEVEIYGYHGANDTPIRDFVFYGVTFLGNVTVTISQVELPASSVDYDPGTSVLRVKVPITGEPKQSITRDFTMTLENNRKNPFGVIIAVGDNGHASGQLYLDDGETLDWYSDQRHTIVDFSFDSNAEPQVLKSEVEIYGYHGANDTPIRDFVFYGVTFLGNVTVTISQVELPASSVDYDPGTSVLRVKVPITGEPKQSITRDFTMTLENK